MDAYTTSSSCSSLPGGGPMIGRTPLTWRCVAPMAAGLDKDGLGVDQLEFVMGMMIALGVELCGCERMIEEREG